MVFMSKPPAHRTSLGIAMLVLGHGLLPEPAHVVEQDLLVVCRHKSATLQMYGTSTIGNLQGFKAILPV